MARRSSWNARAAGSSWSVPGPALRRRPPTSGTSPRCRVGAEAPPPGQPQHLIQARDQTPQRAHMPLDGLAIGGLGILVEVSRQATERFPVALEPVEQQAAVADLVEVARMEEQQAVHRSQRILVLVQAQIRAFQVL